MPIVFRHGSYRFFFYSNEGDPLEPVDIHVMAGDGDAKFWMQPVALADSYGFSARELNKLEKLVNRNSDLIVR
jgi:hypothetical protein